MDLKEVIACFCACYLAGSFPSAYLVTLVMKGVDIRRFGSGNPGATNVFRTVGKTAGVITLFLDIMKGFVPMYLLRGIYEGRPELFFILASLLLAGHAWPVFIGFKGGKGVATGAGILLASNTLAAIAGIVIFGFVFAATRIVSISSICGAIGAAAAGWLLGYGFAFNIFLTIIAAFIIYRHRSNITRLIAGEENPAAPGRGAVDRDDFGEK